MGLISTVSQDQQTVLARFRELKLQMNASREAERSCIFSPVAVYELCYPHYLTLISLQGQPDNSHSTG